MGPREAITEWYANARLAYCILSFYCWSAGDKVGHWRTYISRVMEKGAIYSLALLQDLVAWLRAHDPAFRHCTEVDLWSDCGRHFRNLTTMGTIGAKLTLETGMVWHQHLGAECHFENVCGGYYGLLSHWI